jgi:chromosome segregation ATPase
MSRILQYFNLVGVAALAVLLAIQWQANSRLDELARNLDQTRQEQASKIADLDKTIKGNASDLEDLRDRLSKSEDTVKDDEKKLVTANADKARLQSAVDQDRAIVVKWRDAIAERDQILLKQKEDLQKLASDHGDLVGKYNDLFAKYNDLAGKYNSVVNELNNRNKTGH